MSQEEEKLIEEFKKFISNISYLSKELKEILCEQLKEAYRSGKLAGFEMCEKLIPNDGLLYRIKSLIEEEKKKL